MKKRSKAVFWLIVLLALSALTIYIIVSSNDGFSLDKFLDCLETISPVWFVLAAACAFGFIYFEGAALRCICHRLGCDFMRSRATVYAATDIYYSDITPSDAGEQPAAMVLMMKAGIPGAVAAIALVLNLAMYTLAILVLSLIAFLLNFDMFLGFDFPAQLFIGIGGVVQVAFIVLFAMCIFRIFWIWFIVPLFPTIDGVYLLYPVSWVIGVVLMALYTWKGKWMPKIE